MSDSAKGSLQSSAKTTVPQCSKVWRKKITIDIVGSIYDDDDDDDDDDEGMIIIEEIISDKSVKQSQGRWNAKSANRFFFCLFVCCCFTGCTNLTRFQGLSVKAFQESSAVMFQDKAANHIQGIFFKTFQEVSDAFSISCDIMVTHFSGNQWSENKHRWNAVRQERIDLPVHRVAW